MKLSLKEIIDFRDWAKQARCDFIARIFSEYIEQRETIKQLRLQLENIKREAIE
jgi:hypothetical protein